MPVATLSRMGRKKNAHPTTSIRVSDYLARMIDVITTAEKISTAQLCDPVLEPIIRQRYEAALKALNKERSSLMDKQEK